MNDLALIQAQDITRKIVFEAEAEILKLPQVEMKVVHHFSKDVYGRELHIPKDVILTGAIHKYANLNILSKGDITVLTENGPVRVQAPFTIVSPAGTKRVAYAHEDCIWTTIFGTSETDPEKIVDQFTTNSDIEYIAHRESLKLEGE